MHFYLFSGLCLADESIEMLRLINGERQLNGLADLSIHPSLEKAALMLIKNICQSGRLAHDGPAGNESLEQRAKTFQYHGSRIGENLAEQTGDSLGDVLEQWKLEPGNYANILGDFTETGITSCRNSNTRFWVQVFGKGRPQEPTPLDSMAQDVAFKDIPFVKRMKPVPTAPSVIPMIPGAFTENKVSACNAPSKDFMDDKYPKGMDDKYARVMDNKFTNVIDDRCTKGMDDSYAKGLAKKVKAELKRFRDNLLESISESMEKRFGKFEKLLKEKLEKTKSPKVTRRHRFHEFFDIFDPDSETKGKDDCEDCGKPAQSRITVPEALSIENGS